MQDNKKSRDGLYVYFEDYSGHRCGPVKLNTLEDLEYLIDQHRNIHDRYLVILKDSINGDTPITQGSIEPSITRKRKKR